MSKYIIIEGIISAGKTTLCNGIAEAIGAQAELEPAEGVNPYLDRYYSDPARWGFTMQIYLLSKRYRTHLASQSIVLSGKQSVVSDRSIFGDRVFAKLVHEYGNMSDEDLKTYLSLAKDMCRQCLYPSMFIYLRTPVVIAMERIKQRQREITGRECESSISREYMQRLSDGVETMMDELSRYCPVHYIDAIKVTGEEKTKHEILDEALHCIQRTPEPNEMAPWQGVI